MNLPRTLRQKSERLLRLVESDLFLQGSPELLKVFRHTECDWETALTVSHGINESCISKYGSCMHWPDHCELQIAKQYGAISKLADSSAIKTELVLVLSKIDTALTRRAAAPIDEIIDQISFHFETILLGSVTGRNMRFVAPLEQAYLLGGWPCGWAGSPGDMIVFAPRGPGR